MTHNLSNEIKWRGSTYVLERVEDDLVYWHNPVSRYRDSCTIDSWKVSQPYGSKYE